MSVRNQQGVVTIHKRDSRKGRSDLMVNECPEVNNVDDDCVHEMKGSSKEEAGDAAGLKSQYESKRLGTERRRERVSVACCTGEEKSMSIASMDTDGDESSMELPKIELPKTELPCGVLPSIAEA